MVMYQAITCVKAFLFQWRDKLATNLIAYRDVFGRHNNQQQQQEQNSGISHPEQLSLSQHHQLQQQQQQQSATVDGSNGGRSSSSSSISSCNSTNSLGHSSFWPSSSGKEPSTSSTAATAGLFSNCIMYDQHPSIVDTYSLVVTGTTSASDINVHSNDNNNSNNNGTNTAGKTDNDTDGQMRSKGQQQQQRQHGRRLCSGCMQEIHDPFVLRIMPDLEFHASCLKCGHCECYLDETCTAYIRDNKPYCKEDYVRITDAKKCIRCKEYISRTDMVMKIRTLNYHARCFSCSSCEKKLQPGEEFVLREREDDVLCRADCDPSNIEQPSSIKTDIYGREEEDNWDNSTLTSLDNQMSNTPPLSLRSPKSDEVVFSNSKSQVKKNKKDKQSTRVRTVLNEKQLMTLKACYAANARPDAMMKEHLVEMTGLSPRVIRVWFQNKRCKDKKRQIAMKHMQQKAETERAITGVRMNGVGPLIAASPTPHNDPNLVGIQPVDIHQFTQNSAVWSGMEPMDAQAGGLPPPQHVPLPPTLQPPAAYAQMMPPPHYADLGSDLGYGAMVPGTAGPNNHHFPVNMGTDLEFSPQVNASDLSSPSCSE